MSVVPYWYKLILSWVRVHRRNGLTIPFIIGAELFGKPDKVFKPMSVAELITEIVNSDLGETMTLLYCNDINEYVLGVNSSVYPMQGTHIKNVETNKTILIATLSTEILGTNIQDITKSLTTRYSDCLLDQKYSLSNLEWTEFDDKDEEMIAHALLE